ncbi:MAG: glycosyltransferase [Bacteroidota bacterium]|nr:glycosyltransferase [Bacteroidota bacterium]
MTFTKTDLPLISIIIPAYNSGNTIERSLESIRKQNSRNFEVLIIDAVSKDNTLELARKYEKHFQLLIFSEADRGIYDAMNKGIALAKGKWVYFLGSDDELYAPDTLQKVAEYLQPGIDVIYGNVFSSRFGGVYAGSFDQKKIFNQNICHQSIFFNKDVFKQTGLFDLSYKIWADHDHNFKWFLPGNIKHRFVDVIVANYADGGASSLSPDHAFTKMKNWLYSFQLRNQTIGRTRFWILRRELWSALKEGRIKNFSTITLQSGKYLLNL